MGTWQPHSLTALIPRPRLIARLQTALIHRLTLLVAPAGYGKSTLLSQWLARQPDDRRSAWCLFEQDDADLPAFLSRLTLALAAVIPEEAAQARAALSAPRDDPSSALYRLLHGLAAQTHPLLLVLDDLHLVDDDPAVRETLERLINKAPASLHLVISSRREPPLAAIPRLRTLGQVLELTAADLRFTTAEVIRLVELTLGLTLDEHLASQLTARTEGWAVALRLACQTGARYGPAEAERLIREFGGTVRQLYDYLARVVLAGQSEETRSFLRRTAIFSRLTPAMCDAVLERDDSLTLLTALEQSGLFLFPQDAARTTYRYHTLFREFLQRRLLEVEGREAVRRLHRRAAAWLLAQQDDEGAIEHLLAAGDYEAAADLIRPLQRRLLPRSRHHLLERWLTLFPAAFAETHPWLLITAAKLAAIRGERGRARQLYHRAEPLLLAHDDHAGLHDLYHGLGGLAQDQGDFATAERRYTQALSYTHDDTSRAVLLGQIARCIYMQGGRVPQALKLMSQAVDLAERSHDILGRAGLFSLQGRMRFSLGDLRGALEAWNTALTLLESFGNRHRQVGILNNISHCYCLLGESEQAEEYARKSLTLARLFDRATGYAYALNLLGEIHRCRGEYDAARALHLQALALQQQQDEPYETAATLNWLAVLSRSTGDLAQALRWGEKGLVMREKLGNEYEIGLSLITLGAIHLELGHLDRAGEMWRTAQEIFVRHQARYEQAQLDFYLAVLSRRQGADAAARSHLAAALDLARRYDYAPLFLREPAWAAPLLVAPASAGDDFAADLLLRLGRPALDHLLPLLDAPDPSVRARAAALLGRLGDAQALKPLAAHRHDPDAAVRSAVEEALAALTARPAPPLHILTLGRFRLRCGDREISHWPRRSARDVFLLLLLRHPQATAADALAEALWPGSPPDKASQNLRRAVSDLRRTLQPELPPGFPSGYLRVDEETYALLLPSGSYRDDLAFERAVRAETTGDIPAAPEERETAIARLETALALYAGDYLPELPYTDWVLSRREHLRRLFVAGARRLARLHRAAGRPEEAVAAARRALAQEPWDEEGTLLLMQAYADLGDLPAAVRAYETHRQRLWDDLGLAPRPDLTAFYDRLRAQEEEEEVRRKREGDHRAPPASGDLPYSRDRV